MIGLEKEVLVDTCLAVSIPRAWRGDEKEGLAVRRHRAHHDGSELDNGRLLLRVASNILVMV